MIKLLNCKMFDNKSVTKTVISNNDLNALLEEYKQLAIEHQKKTNAAHVLYAELFSKNGELDTLYLYKQLDMDDSTFELSRKRSNGCTYAIHKATSK